MANAQRGEVGFEADGKAYVIRFGTNAMCDIEASMGKSMTAIIAELETGASIGTMRAIFAGGVGVPPKDAGALIDAIGFAKASELVTQAFQLAFPEATGEPGKPTATA